MKRDSERALLQTGAAAVLWGTSFPVITLGIQTGLDPRTFVFLRFALAAPIMLIAARAMGRDVLSIFRGRAVWVLGALNAIGFLSQFIAQQYTTAAEASLLVNLSVVLAAAGGAVFLHERLGGAKAGGVALAVAGTVLITTNGDLGTLMGGELEGAVLCLVAAASWAVYIVYAKKVSSAYDPFALACGVVAVTAVVVFPPSLLGSWDAATNQGALLLVAYTAVFNTSIPFVLYQQGLKHLTAGTSAVVLMVEIVIAIVLSVTLLGEAFGPLAWAGALALVLSIVLVSGMELGGKSLSVPLDEATGAQGT